MLGMSFSEVVIIFLIAFLVVGPKKMTSLAYEIGIWIGKFKQQLKIIKETQLDTLNDSVFYDPKIEMNQSLEDLKKNEELPNDTAKTPTSHFESEK